MKDKFIELIKNEFRIEYLESQLVGLSENDLKEFLLFSMNEFEKIRVEGWLKIIEAYHDTGFVYLYESGFDKDYFGRMGFYIEDIDTTQTSNYLIAENHLDDFINQCNRILKYRLVGQTKAPQQSNKLKIDQIALKYAYEELQITRENGNRIAKEYGHNSGEKLFQRFSHYSSAANRKGKPTLCTPKRLSNKIKLIESIIDFLPIDKQERAKDEVLILKNIYDAEYQ